MQNKTSKAFGVWPARRWCPQADRMRKQDMWLSLQESAEEGRLSWYPRGVDVTDVAVAQRWLWACNLGSNTAHVIGTGIDRTFLTWRSAVEYCFRFVRVDGSDACVALVQEVKGGNTGVYTRMLRQ